MEEKPSKDGHLVYTFRVADDSGSAILSLFDDAGKSVENGDILLIVGGFVTVFQNEIRLSCKLGTVLRQGRFTMTFSDQPDHSSFCWMPSPDDPTKLIKQLPTLKPARRPFKKEPGNPPKVRKSSRKPSPSKR